MRALLLFAIAMLFLQGCEETSHMAPVQDIDMPQTPLWPNIKPLVQAKVLHPQVVSSTQPLPPIHTKWLWPAEGQLIKKYSPNSNGIDIAGKLGVPIYAALPGEVVYSGHGLRGYGNLIILKHGSAYISTYAYNRRLLVKEGERVVQGQKIAEMGHSEVGRATLHFEVRHHGRPVDPLSVLNPTTI